MKRRLSLAAFAVVAALASMVLAAHLVARPATADEGWTIDNFVANIDVQQDGSMVVEEAIDVDFGSLEKHGIFREIPIEYAYDAKKDRVYGFDVMSVTDANRQPLKYEQSRNGTNVRLKIGDPDETVTGKQSYRISYRVTGALNAFADHDELYWNVNGPDWPVPTKYAAAVVRIPGGVYPRISCFEGPTGSTEPCRSLVSDAGEGAMFSGTRPFASGEQLTVVVAIPPGAVAAPQIRLVDKPKSAFEQYFALGPGVIVVSALLLVAGLAALGWAWWRNGRDRTYTSIYYLTQNPEERTRRLWARDQVVVEYTPPDALRPAQMGLLLDESADTKDVTATIIDLAVRGYLKIDEKEKSWAFGKKDWHLTRKKPGTDLQMFERTILDGLFETGDEVDLSDLKTKYADSLQQAERELYADSVGNGWFGTSPAFTRTRWRVGGFAVAAAGVGGGYLLGRWFGWAIIGAPLVSVGLLQAGMSPMMPRRTAKGSEALRRVLGFRLFIDTAEKDRAKFAEQANIFSEYLPYAVVFGCVEKWARVFREIDTQAQVQGWYAGSHPGATFAAADFSRSLETFSSSVSNVIASTPGSSGSSGFGGSSGGGGGGGGGGSW
ncbi:MAG TPA: DUF2207 domain-containing protein [Dehalococcoidia bacterium]|nr:DUF2207 domain-containing protein [Dehalococcoidia bacterium]